MGQTNSRGASASQSRSRRRANSALPAVTVTPPTPTTSLTTVPASIKTKERHKSSFRRRRNKDKSKDKVSEQSSLAVPSTSTAPTHTTSEASSGSSGIAFPSSSRHRTRSTPPNYGASSSTTATHRSSSVSNSDPRHSADNNTRDNMGIGIHGALSLAPEPRSGRDSKRSSFRKSIMNLVRPTSLFDSTPKHAKPDSEPAQEATTVDDALIEGGDMIEEVPREAQQLQAAPTKGKSKQDVPEDAISVASLSSHHQARPTASSSGSHHSPALAHDIAGSDDVQDPPHLVITDRDGARETDEDEHAVTAWFEEELERVEESAAAQRAAAGPSPSVAPSVSLPPPMPPVVRPTPAPISTTPSAAPAAAQVTSPPGSVGTGTTAAGTPRHFPPPGTLVVVQGIVHTSDAPPASPSPVSPTMAARPIPSRAQSDSTSSSGSTLAGSTGPTTGQTTPEHIEARPVPPAISNGSIDVLGTLLSVAASATAASLLTGNAPTWNGSGTPPVPSPTRTTPIARPRPPRLPTPSPTQPTTPSSPPTHQETNEDDGEGAHHPGRAERIRSAWGTMLDRLGWSSSNSRDNESLPRPEAQPESARAAAALGPGPGILRNGSTTTPTSPASGATVGAGASPRDVMLAEMARAFNIGLGLDSNPSGNSGLIHDSVNRASAAAASTTPPPSSPTLTAPSSQSSSVSTATGPEPAAHANVAFDRFLADIQTDLRVALVPPGEEEVEAGAREERERMEREHEERERALRAATQSQQVVRQEEEPVVREQPQPHVEETREESGTASQLRAYQERHRFREELGRPMIDTTPPIPTPEVSTSPISTSSTASPASGATSTTDSTATPVAPARQPLSLAELSVASTTGSGTTALGSGRIDVNGRINWWRMYRFPAVTSVPGARGAAAAAAAAASAGSPSIPTSNSSPSTVPTSSTTTPPAVTTPGGATVPTSPTSILPSFPAPTAGQPVVPVIVVGLQSVNSVWQQEELANIAAAAGGPEAASAIRRSSVAGSVASPPLSPISTTSNAGVLARGSGGESRPVSPVMRPQSPTSPVSTVHTTSSSSSGRRRRERRVWTPEEIEASPFGWPPMDWDDESSDEENEDEEGGAREEEEEGEEEAQRMIDEQQRRREERSAFRNSRAASVPPLDSVPSSPLPASPTSPAAPTSPLTNAPPPTLDANGNPQGAARTFLIYVVGGYYPPDHTIVTGGLDNFESFEALLELAEMLGHAKPPTVSKEDIEKSGLETIKMSMLGQYEDEGRVSYNCIERCLICLDDYDEEDDIRIMSCRHAFHKDCVDKWLQTGKNNCPACRSTGVGSS